jgi:hypothetical protein
MSRCADVKRSQLAKAAEEFLLEGYEYQAAEKILRETPAELQDEARRRLLPKRTVAEGYFIWLGYLVWLESVLEVQPSLTLLAGEVEGLIILRRARDHFRATHPPCPHCGMPNEEHALRCRECMKEIAT